MYSTNIVEGSIGSSCRPPHTPPDAVERRPATSCSDVLVTPSVPMPPYVLAQSRKHEGVSDGEAPGVRDEVGLAVTDCVVLAVAVIDAVVDAVELRVDKPVRDCDEVPVSVGVVLDVPLLLPVPDAVSVDDGVREALPVLERVLELEPVLDRVEVTLGISS